MSDVLKRCWVCDAAGFPGCCHCGRRPRDAEIERLRADLKAAADDREACLMFLRTEMMWEEFREEFMSNTASGENARKLMEFLRRFEKPEAGDTPCDDC